MQAQHNNQPTRKLFCIRGSIISLSCTLYIPVSSYLLVITLLLTILAIFTLVLSKPQYFCKYTRQFKLEAAIISFKLRDYQYACGCVVVVFYDIIFKVLSTTATSVTFAIENCTSTQKHILKTQNKTTKQNKSNHCMLDLDSLWQLTTD
jgi:hypothetical protein